jgi:hypothetical protein
VLTALGAYGDHRLACRARVVRDQGIVRLRLPSPNA